MSRLPIIFSLALSIFAISLAGCTKEPDAPPTVDKKRQEENDKALGGKFKKSDGKSY